MSSTIGALSTRRARTRRGQRILNARAPKVVENVKVAMFIKAPGISSTVTRVLTDFYHLKKPDAVWYRRKESNRIAPFEDVTPIEFYSNRSDASLFMFGNHNKKHPDNLVVGRMYNWSLLDMIEFGVSHFKSLDDFSMPTQAIGSKPMFVIAGSEFETEEIYQVAANLFVDFFRGHVVKKLNIQGLDHVIALNVTHTGEIHFSHYSVHLKKTGTHIPKVHLEEIGPSMNLKIRRYRLSTEDLKAESLKVPSVLKPAKVKNVFKTALRSKLGRIHISGQDLSRVMTKKSKGLKRKSSHLKDRTSSQKRTKRH